jgi:hypothetical protein
LAIVGVVATMICLIVTRHGVGFDTDSGPYYGAAYNLVHGHGLTTPFTFFTSPYGPKKAVSFHNAVPLTHFPPLFPATLGVAGVLGLSISTAARVLNALLLGVNVFLAGLLVLRLTKGRGVLPASLCAGVLLVGPTAWTFSATGRPNWLALHSTVMSEPLFIMFCLSALVVIDVHLVGGSRAAFYGAAALAALALLTRYVGVSVIVTGAIAILFLRAVKRHRVRDAAVFALIGVAPTLVWDFYTTEIQHGAAPRRLDLHSAPGTLRGLLDVVEKWLLPGSWSSGVRDVALVVVIALVAALIYARRGSTQLRGTTVGVLGTFGVTYIVVVVFSRHLLDASVPMDPRILAPLQAIVYALLFALVWSALMTVNRGALVAAGGSVALAFVLIAMAISPTASLVKHGYPQTPETSVMRAVRQLPKSVFIATNLPEGVFLQTRRSSIELPMRVDPLTGGKNSKYGAQLEELGAVLRARDSVVVLFPSPARLNQPTIDELRQIAALHPVMDGPDGSIWRVTAN